MTYKNKRLKVTLGILLVSLCIFMVISVKADEIPEEAQETLVYDVLEWEDGSWGSVEWTIWGSDYSSVYKGNYSSSKGGKIEVTITGNYEKNATYEAWEDLNFIPYGDLSIYEKVENGYELNFTLTNISMNEMGSQLVYGFLGWDPAFKVSTDWEENSQIALSKENNPYVQANVTIVNDSNTVTYDFKEVGGMAQTTILTYNKSSGILLEAITEVGLYKSHIRLQGYIPSNISIPGISVSGLLFFIIIGGAIGIFIHRKKINN
ncbi:MAG: hypothetical protein ACTSWY_01190 [Promethearchaeota archaeon]